jgi:hypothetical protein
MRFGLLEVIVGHDSTPKSIRLLLLFPIFWVGSLEVTIGNGQSVAKS